MRHRFLIVFVFVSIFQLDSFGQMIAGHYPFQILDTIIFKPNKNILLFDSDIKFENFQKSKEIDPLGNKKAFIAGITNSTNDTLSFPIQGSSLIGILEAKDTDEKWKPIQFWPISGCGNSYYSVYLLPKQSIIFPIENKFGKTETTMRIRLHGKDTIYISDAFQGKIDPKMFTKPKNATKDFRHILCDSIFYLESPRFGDLNGPVKIEIATDFE
ncbi:MAG: hypothetical protein K0M50_09570 [Prolixibacteraceae bacterium]|nr:hypothetical protein [Prolixibacteraceae bacterium]